MLFKLSARNVKRSFKDYTIYFLTLTFAVCIFYSFNSISESGAMAKLTISQSDMVQSITQLMSIISVFVSVVLGFLILFANNFLIRRRKKELGLYMTLGMSKYKISQIVVLETFLVGLLSLVAGLAIGAVISQGLSVLVVSLFDADITKLKFVFSTDAMIKTMTYFGLIFFCVMIFNSIVISKYKLIDLLTAARKNETLKVRKTSTSIVLFILSITLLAAAYSVILKYGLFESMTIMWTCVAIGSLGTFLFFMSLSGFILNMLQKNKGIYFKNVNMFVVRQINSKVNTTFVSMTVICLMLFFTIGVLSTAFSIKNAGERNLDEQTPYDATLYVEDWYDVRNITEATEMAGIDLDEMGEKHVFDISALNTNYNELLLPYSTEELLKYFDMAMSYESIKVLKASDYAKIMEMQGKEAQQLSSDEVLIITDDEKFFETVNNYISSTQTINISETEYKIANEQVENLQYMTTYAGEFAFTVVAPDEAVEGLPIARSVVNLNYDGHAEQNDETLYHAFNSNELYEKYGFVLFGMTETLFYDYSIGSSTMIVFIGIYIGIVFLISSAAVLALQQLSEASDNMERYSMLRKIGVTRKGINKAIFAQIFIYFMMPLSLAIVHSIFGIKAVNQEMIMMGQPSVFIPALFTALIMVVIYGGYFIATYIGYKNIVK
ncbi:FtsX-like permease family protein [Bacillus sp. AGMB 02131]|uniref:FtsX-like permease family protein n=1 Tax=Peribacillus faecalis TaxID=2772559 RepID=A0A927CZS4_9BACI|nr:FtsX-like permease family protein [Peribacillus faecalis]MBD3108795.1 FtsX-like permease family protein [Peribacillus faecalis]